MSLERFLRCPALNGGQDGWKTSPWLGNGLWIIPGPAPRSHRDGPGEGIRLPGASRAAGTSFQRHSQAKRGKSGSGPCPRCCSLRRDAPDAGNSWSAGMGLDGAGWDSLDPSRASCTSLGQSICWRSSRIPGSILVSLGSSLPLQCLALIPKPRFPQNSQLVWLMRRRTQSQALGGRAVPSPSSPGSGAHRGALGSFQAPLSRACSYLQTGAGTGSGASPGFLGMLPRDPGPRHSRRGWRSPRTPPEGQDALRRCHRSPPAPNPGIWDHRARLCTA